MKISKAWYQVILMDSMFASIWDLFELRLHLSHLQSQHSCFKQMHHICGLRTKKTCLIIDQRSFEVSILRRLRDALKGLQLGIKESGLHRNRSLLHHFRSCTSGCLCFEAANKVPSKREVQQIFSLRQFLFFDKKRVKLRTIRGRRGVSTCLWVILVQFVAIIENQSSCVFDFCLSFFPRGLQSIRAAVRAKLVPQLI